MIEVVNNGNGTWTITPDKTEREVIERAEREHSPTILTEVLEGWERGEREMFRARDADALATNVQKLTAEEIAQIPEAVRTKLSL